MYIFNKVIEFKENSLYENNSIDDNDRVRDGQFSEKPLNQVLDRL